MVPGAAGRAGGRLQLHLSAPERVAGVVGLCYLLGKLHDLPYLVGGRLALVAHGLPVAVPWLEVLMPSSERALLGEAVRRFSAVRWSERWQEFCDYRPPEQPGPLRWQVGPGWELRFRLLEQLPAATTIRLGEADLRVPVFPWLLANEPDAADLLARLKRAGWTASPAAARGEG